MKIFLGGTYNNTTWREELIEKLSIDYFNPVVKDWTPECQSEEIRQRETCDFVVYTITPRMTGVYSIAEAVDDSNKRPTKTIFCVLKDDVGVEPFGEFQLRSLKATSDMIVSNGGVSFTSLQDVADYVNSNERIK